MSEQPAPPGNILVATKGPDDPLDLYEGAGVWSSSADVVAAARPLWTGGEFSAAEYQAASVGLALDVLGAADDPLRELLLAPAVGWLIEHVEFVREPFDRLAGDPGQITLHARTWHNIAGRLTEVADEHERAVTGLTGWRGEACDAYRGAAQGQGRALRRAAAQAERLAGQVMDNGALVGTVRSLIRDMIADLVARLITWLVGSLAVAPVSGGASMAAYVAAAVESALATAAKIMKLVRELLARLKLAASGMDELAGLAEEALTGLKGVGTGVARADGLPRDAAIETAKQATKADREQADWDTPQQRGGWTPLPAPAPASRYGVPQSPEGDR